MSRRERIRARRRRAERRAQSLPKHPERTEDEVAGLIRRFCSECDDSQRRVCAGPCKSCQDVDVILVRRLQNGAVGCPHGRFGPVPLGIALVYPYRNDGADGRDLKYSIRSFVKHFADLGDVFVVGDRPTWLSDEAIHVACDDSAGRSKDSRMVLKIMEACRHPRITSTFIRCSDDQCLLKPMRMADWQPRYVCDLQNTEPADWGIEGRRYRVYRNKLTRTIGHLQARERPAFYYDTHIPQPCRPDFLKVMGDLDSVCINTAYYNLSDWPRVAMGHERADVSQPMDRATSMQAMEGKTFLNSKGRAWKGGDYGAVLEELFPEPSRFEKPAATSVAVPVAPREAPKLAVALLTCDRLDYTKRTVESLLKHNDTSDWALYWADDASTEPGLREYVASKGFEPVVMHDERKGCSPTTEALMRAVAEQVAPTTPLLYLQNDFESTRPIPLEQNEAILARGDVSFVQLCYRPPRSRYNRRMPWLWSDGQEWKFGDASRGEYVFTPPGWGTGYHPCIASVASYTQATSDIRRERQFRGQCARMGKRLARLTLPVMRHIGLNITPDGEFGVAHKNRHSRVGQANYDTTAEPGFKRNLMHAGPTLLKHVASYLHPGMRTLECGSGLSTWIFVALGCEHTALEHKAKYAPPLPEVVVRPLTGEPAWYDWKPDAPYDLILVDGPPGGKRLRRGKPGRMGILRVIADCVHSKTIILLDDSQRAHDSKVADAIATQLNMTRRDIGPEHSFDGGKRFSILEPR